MLLLGENLADGVCYSPQVVERKKRGGGLRITDQFSCSENWESESDSNFPRITAHLFHIYL